MKKIANLCNFSLDYVTLDEKCSYPRNLNLIKIAKKIDAPFSAQSRANIESTIDNFLKMITDKENEIIFDNIDIELTDNVHSNFKAVRKLREITQQELAEKIGVNRSAITLYERSTSPTVENIIKLSEVLNISIHALVTGEKLDFDFQDRPFGQVIMLADQLLPLEQQKILITLMEAMIQ